MVTPIRVECANLQRAALRNNHGMISIRHTTNAKAAVAQARQALGLTFEYVDAFEAQAEQLVNTTMTDAGFIDLSRAVFGTTPADATKRAATTAKKREQTLLALWADAATQATVRGTAWAGYQAVVEYVDHHAPVRSADRPADQARAERLLTTSGPNQAKDVAWAFATATL